MNSSARAGATLPPERRFFYGLDSLMIRLAIIDEDGKIFTPQEVTTSADLLVVVSQARHMVQVCERLAREKSPATSSHKAETSPYST
jgi:hypothetical protein